MKATELELLASRAMWAGDYEKSLYFYQIFSETPKERDGLTDYKTDFEMLILNILLRKSESEYYKEKLMKHFMKLEQTPTDLDLIKQDIKEQKRKRETNPETIAKSLKKHLPTENKALAYLISPYFAKQYLQATLKSSEKIQTPHIFEEGIFRYSVVSELSRVVARAYSVDTLELEKIESYKIQVLNKQPNVYYVEDEELRVIASIRREGMACYQYHQKGRPIEGV